MGLLDDYLNSDTSSKSAAPEVKSSGGGLLEQYLNTPETTTAPKAAAPIRPPISGVSETASNEINAQPAKAGGVNPREQALIEGIRNLPNNVGNAIVKDFKEGTETVGEGVSDILSNKPASGIGKVGLGALSTLVSPISGTSKEVIAKPVTELTGNKQAGDIAEIALTGGLPITKATKATIAAIPKNKALKTLVESIGPENAGAVAKAMRENPRLTPADLSPKVKQDVQSLFVNDGPHINYLANRVTERAEGAKAAVEGAMDSSLGATVNAVDKVNELKQNIRNVGSQKIQPALEKAGPVDVTPVVKSIDDILKPGVNSVISNETQLASPEVNKQLELIRKYLTDDKSMRSDPAQLHQIQSALRSKAEAMLSSSSGQDRQIGSALMKVRNGIVDAIDAATVNGKQSPIKALPSGSSLAVPPAPTLDNMKSLSKVESVPLSSVKNTQDKMDWDKFNKGEHPAPLIKGYEDKPIAVKKENGEYLIFDGHHRSVKAINDGQKNMDMYVVNAKDYAPEFAGRKAAKSNISDDELLKQLGDIPVTRQEGSYKKALGNYRDEFHIQDAFEHGHDAIITNSKSITNRPEFFKEWVKKASPEELEAAKEGARIAIDTQINGFKHAARRGTDVGEVEFNRQRIEALFGKEEADKLFTKLKHEREIADTNNKIVQGSQTAMRSASKEAFALPEKTDSLKNLVGPAAAEAINLGGMYLSGGSIPGAGVAAYGAMKGATAVKDAISLKLAREHNARYSKYAMPEAGAREELIQALEAVASKPPKQSIVRRAANTGVRLGSLIAP